MCVQTCARHDPPTRPCRALISSLSAVTFIMASLDCDSANVMELNERRFEKVPSGTETILLSWSEIVRALVRAANAESGSDVIRLEWILSEVVLKRALKVPYGRAVMRFWKMSSVSNRVCAARGNASHQQPTRSRHS